MLAFLLITTILFTLVDTSNEEPEEDTDIVDGADQGNETINLADSGETFIAHGSNHTVYGGRGDDTYIFDDNVDSPTTTTFWGSAGNDTMSVHTDSNSDITLFGGSGNDTFEVDNPYTFIYGGRGDDIFEINEAALVDGGVGNDQFNLVVDANNLSANMPIILFNKASDSMNIELEGFSSDEVTYLVDVNNAGTTIRIGNTDIMYLLNETGLERDVVQHPIPNLQISFV